MPFLLHPRQEERAAGGDAQARASGKARGEQDPCKHPSRSPTALKRLVVPSRAVGTEDLPVTPGTCSLGHFSGSGEQQMKGLPPPEQLLKAQSTQEMQHVEGKVAVTVALGQRRHHLPWLCAQGCCNAPVSQRDKDMGVPASMG